MGHAAGMQRCELLLMVFNPAMGRRGKRRTNERWQPERLSGATSRTDDAIVRTIGKTEPIDPRRNDAEGNLSGGVDVCQQKEVQGLKDIKGTIAGFFDDTETKPFVAADSADGCKLYLYPSADAPTKYWYGPAWLDVSVNTAVAGAVAISGSFAANGAWGRQ